MSTTPTTPALSDEGLLPCPFCGKEGWLFKHSSALIDEYSVRCEDGCCEVGDEYEEEAVRCWNTRMGQDAILATRPPVKGDSVELVERARDEAQSMVQALCHVIECLEAHIMDRAAMSDPASPETYLSILRADYAQVKRPAEQICAARWHQAKEAADRITALSERVVVLEGVLREARAIVATWTLYPTERDLLAKIDTALKGCDALGGAK